MWGFPVGVFICERSVQTWSFSRNYVDHSCLSTLPANSPLKKFYSLLKRFCFVFFFSFDVWRFSVGVFICERSVQTWSFSRNYVDHTSLSTLPLIVYLRTFIVYSKKKKFVFSLDVIFFFFFFSRYDFYFLINLGECFFFFFFSFFFLF